MRSIILWLISYFILLSAVEADQPVSEIDLQRQLKELTENLPSVQDLKNAIDPMEARKLIEATSNASGDTNDSAHMREMIMSMNRQTLSDDVIQETLTQSLSPQGGMDPNGSMTYASGPHGLLWIFWAMDAPGIESLPSQINGAQEMLPELIIRDSHVMPLSKWQDFIRKLSNLKDALELAPQPGESLETSIQRKKRMRDAAMPPLLAATLMSRSRRRGGYLLIEDQSPGISYHVTDVPQLIYLSPLGVVHRMKGINSQRPIRDWIVQTQMWEKENQDVLKLRGVIK